MGAWSNQGSFVIGAALLLAALGLAIFSAGVTRERLVVFGVVAAIAVAVPLALRTGQGVSSIQAAEARIGQGAPALLEFYSDF
jgi:hypothetical protein